MRPSFLEWATGEHGLFLHDRRAPTLASWSPYQAAILDHLFPGGDEDSPLPYTRVIWSAPKKSAKSTLAAGLHLYFALYIDIPGEQYALANDLEGAKSRAWRYIVGSLAKNPRLVEKEDWRVSGNTISLSNGAIIRAIPSDYRGEAGANHSFVSVDEPWGILTESGVRLMTEFAPVPTRPHSTIFYTGYAGWNTSVFWHDLIDKALAGEPVPELIHLENGDGQPACWRNGRTFAYVDHIARMPWHTPEYLAEQRRIMPPGEYLRVFENRRVQHVDAFCTPDQWESLRDPDLRALCPGEPRAIVLGADAATKADCTALVGCAWNAERRRVEVLYCRVWEPRDGRPLRLTETIGPEIVRLSQEYHVAAVYFDPFQMVAIAELCKRVSVRMVEFPQTERRIQADTHLHQLIWGGNLAHYGDPALKAHVINALTKPNERGLRIIKERGSVDAAVALSMATLGAVELLASAPARKLQAAHNPFFPGG
jgi:phage terminase large subunit-like protein